MSEQAAQSQHQDELWSRLVRTQSCVEYCYDRTVDLLDRKDALARQVFYRAGLIMGRDAEAARHIVRLMKRKGGFEGAEAWLAQPPSLYPIWVKGPSLDHLGFVYTARVRAFPHIIKIGFSTRPEKRMRELEYVFGQSFDLEETRVGTPLDEVRAHIAAGRRYIKREFVFDPLCADINPARIPDFILSSAELDLVAVTEGQEESSVSLGRPSDGWAA